MLFNKVAWQMIPTYHVFTFTFINWLGILNQETLPSGGWVCYLVLLLPLGEHSWSFVWRVRSFRGSEAFLPPGCDTSDKAVGQLPEAKAWPVWSHCAQPRICSHWPHKHIKSSGSSSKIRRKISSLAGTFGITSFQVCRSEYE